MRPTYPSKRVQLSVSVWEGSAEKAQHHSPIKYVQPLGTFDAQHTRPQTRNTVKRRFIEGKAP